MGGDEDFSQPIGAKLLPKSGSAMLSAVRGHPTTNAFSLAHKYACRVVSAGWLSALTTPLRRRAALGAHSLVCPRRWPGAPSAHRARAGPRNPSPGLPERRPTGPLAAGAAGKEGIRRVEGTRPRGHALPQQVVGGPTFLDVKASPVPSARTGLCEQGRSGRKRPWGASTCRGGRPGPGRRRESGPPSPAAAACARPAGPSRPLAPQQARRLGWRSAPAGAWRLPAGDLRRSARAFEPGGLCAQAPRGSGAGGPRGTWGPRGPWGPGAAGLTLKRPLPRVVGGQAGRSGGRVGCRQAGRAGLEGWRSRRTGGSPRRQGRAGRANGAAGEEPRGGGRRQGQAGVSPSFRREQGPEQQGGRRALDGAPAGLRPPAARSVTRGEGWAARPGEPTRGQQGCVRASEGLRGRDGPGEPRGPGTAARAPLQGRSAGLGRAGALGTLLIPFGLRPRASRNPNSWGLVETPSLILTRETEGGEGGGKKDTHNCTFLYRICTIYFSSFAYFTHNLTSFLQAELTQLI